MPLDCRKAPRKTGRLAMRPLGHGRRRLRPISGEPVAGSARKGSGSSPGSPRARFTPTLEVGVAPTVPGEGTAATRPPLQRAWRQRAAAGTSGGYASARGEARGGWLATTASGGGSPARRRQWWPSGELREMGRVCAREATSRPFTGNVEGRVNG
jgi:hypothetical protein